MREAKKVPTTVVRRRSKSPEEIYQHNWSPSIIVYQHGSSFISIIHHSSLYSLWKCCKMITIFKFGRSHNKFFCVIRCHHHLHLVMWRPPLWPQFLRWVGCPTLLACKITVLIQTMIYGCFWWLGHVQLFMWWGHVHCKLCKVEFPELLMLGLISKVSGCDIILTCLFPAPATRWKIKDFLLLLMLNQRPLYMS